MRKGETTGYACPVCNSSTEVKDSRRTDDGIRRRRACRSTYCGHRFTTYESQALVHDHEQSKIIARLFIQLHAVTNTMALLSAEEEH